MLTAAQSELVIDTACSWIGTPFMHQGRTKGIGADCACLAIDCAESIGATGDFIDVPDYARQPDGRLRKYLEKHMDRVLAADRAPGDVLLFFEQHLAILGDSFLVHAYEPNGKVIQQPFDKRWRRMIRGVYRYRVD